ncbi:MAG: tetratricopeptide repeat protein, partial [Bdellovibrionota bacterium]
VGPTIEYLRKALELDPRHTDASVCLSILFNDIGKYDEAKEIFEKANQLVASRSAAPSPNRAEGNINRKFALKHLELAEMYFRYKRYDEAIEEYGKASTLDPTALDSRIRRAKAFAKKGFVSRAMQELQVLKSEYPSFMPAKVQLGLLHYSQGNLLDAELEWQSVLEIDPAHREARSYLELAKQQK